MLVRKELAEELHSVALLAVNEVTRSIAGPDTYDLNNKVCVLECLVNLINSVKVY